jgi:pimeloyl-ACP methyl ester carboxylesterase
LRGQHGDERTRDSLARGCSLAYAIPQRSTWLPMASGKSSSGDNTMYKDVPHSDLAFAQVNGIRIAYDTFGDTSSPPLLLIMGLGGQMINWHEEFCAQLAAEGYWVIRFDNRDVGLSSKFDEAGVPHLNALTRALERGQAVDLPYTLRDMANDAVGVLDELQVSAAHLLGTSMGGRIAQLIALYSPNRVRTLIPIMSPMGEPGYPPPKPEALAILHEPAPSDREGYIEYSVRAARALSGPAFPIEEHLVRERAGKAFDRGVNPGGIARQLAALTAAGGVKKDLGSLTTPTLVIHGSHDPLIPVECAVDMASTIPGAQLLIVEGLGHSLADFPRLWPQVIDAVTRHAI